MEEKKGKEKKPFPSVPPARCQLSDDRGGDDRGGEVGRDKRFPPEFFCAKSASARKRGEEGPRREK